MVVDYGDRLRRKVKSLIRNLTLSLAASVILAGCATPVPDSGAGVGISQYSQYEIERARLEAQRDRSDDGSPIVPPGMAAAQTDGGGDGAITSDQLAAAGIGRPADTAGAASDAAPAEAAQVDQEGGAAAQGAPSELSDTQDFDAVTARLSAEANAAELARQREAYRVIPPQPLPERDADVGVNIVEYALSAPNRVGQEWYSRSLLVIDREGKFRRNCARFRSPDEAQREFLARGGPERDPLGVDPDGDGFACGWNPAPFLTAVGQG